MAQSLFNNWLSAGVQKNLFHVTCSHSNIWYSQRFYEIYYLQEAKFHCFYCHYCWLLGEYDPLGEMSPWKKLPSFINELPLLSIQRRGKKFHCKSLFFTLEEIRQTHKSILPVYETESLIWLLTICTDLSTFPHSL